MNVFCMSKGHYELRPHSPVFHKLLETIKNNEFDIIEYSVLAESINDLEMDEAPDLNALMEQVQSSPYELQQELKNLEVFYFRGQWTRLNDRTKTELYKSIMNTIVMNGYAGSIDLPIESFINII